MVAQFPHVVQRLENSHQATLRFQQRGFLLVVDQLLG
jgi:hypothetical protein